MSYRTSLETWIIQNTSFTDDSVHLAVQWCPGLVKSLN